MLTPIMRKGRPPSSYEMRLRVSSHLTSLLSARTIRNCAMSSPFCALVHSEDRFQLEALRNQAFLALILASRQGSLGVAHALLDAGADVDAAPDYGGATALFAASVSAR